MGERLSGTVKWFNVQKGFGFIIPNYGGEDLFVHQSSIRSDGFRSLGEGETVEYRIESGNDGRTKAVDVTGPNEGPVQGSRGGGGDGGGGGGWRSSRGGGRSGGGRDGGGGYGGGGYGGGGYGGGYGGGAGGGGSCYKCGESGHFARDCYQSGGSNSGGGSSSGGGCYNCSAIEGLSIESVNRASEKKQIIIDEKQAVEGQNRNYSHFISLPLAIHPELVKKLLNFQNSILGNGDSNEDATDKEVGHRQLGKQPDFAVELKVDDDNEHVKVNMSKIPLVSYAPKASKSSPLSADLGIDKSIFTNPKTFHLTVLMLKLWNEDRVSAAAKVLQSISSKVMDALDNRPVSIRLKGLDIMKGSLTKACVLYAPVEEIGSEDRLLRACQVITDAYVEAGLVLEKDANQKLKLHATVMNVSYRKRRTWTGNADSFDACGVFKQFGSEEWGEYLIREAHLSQRHKFDENGYYHRCALILFPENTQDGSHIGMKK